MDKPIDETVLKEIHPDELVKLATDLVNIPSPTGFENDVGNFLSDWFKKNGFSMIRQEVEDGRSNIIGLLKGSKKGKSLMFNSHIDTSFTGTDADYLILGEVAEACKPAAYIENNRICGLGVNNDKGPLAAFLTAALAIKRSNIQLKGDLILAAVVGEIGRAPVGHHSGKESRGKGVGTRFLLTHGIVSDYALVAEPSSFTISWALPGAVFIRLTTTGRPAYTPFTRRDEKGVSYENAIVRMIPVIEAIERWGADYQKKNVYKFDGGMIVPKVNIGAIEGGLAIKPNYSPGICHLYIDVRIPPGHTPLETKRNLEAYLEAEGIAADLDMYLSQKGYEGKGVGPLVAATRKAHQTIFGAKPDQISSEHTSMWNDVNIYHEHGIPAIKYGPPTISYGKKREESLAVDDLLKAAKVYALAALEICNAD